MNDLCSKCVNSICCALKNINNKSFSKVRCFNYFEKINEINNEIDKIKEELKTGGKISAKEISLRIECVVGYEPQYVGFSNKELVINYGFGEKKYNVGNFKKISEKDN